MNRAIKYITNSLLLSSSLFILGCMGSNPPSAGSMADGAGMGQLSTMHWQLQNIKEGATASVAHLKSGIPANRYQLNFSGKQLQLKGGCNFAGGAVKIQEAGKLSVGPLMVTNRGCAQNLMAADTEVINALARVSDYRLHGQHLSLFGVGKVLQFTGTPTVETIYGGEGVRKFIDVKNTAQGLQWREATYDSNWVRTNENAPWIKGNFPGIKGFEADINNEYTVRIKEFRDNSGKAVWVKDRITMQGILK